MIHQIHYKCHNLTRVSHPRTNMINRRERMNAGKAARTAKLISFALRIWSISSIALFSIHIKDVRILKYTRILKLQASKDLIHINSHLDVQFQLLNLTCKNDQVTCEAFRQQSLSITYRNYEFGILHVTWMSKARASSPLKRF